MSIVDRIESVLTLELVKHFLEIDHAEDDILLPLMTGYAAEQADLFLNNEFTEVDAETGETTNLDIPNSVIIGCLMLIKDSYENRGASPVVGKRVGDMSLQFGEPSESVLKKWRPYRKLPGL